VFSPGFLSLDLDKRFRQSLGSVHPYGRTTTFGRRKREFMTIMCRILRCDKQNTLTEFEPSFRQKSHHFRQQPLNSTYIIQLFAKIKNKKYTKREISLIQGYFMRYLAEWGISFSFRDKKICAG